MNFPPRNIVIFGPQGTGKTRRAREVVRKWRVADPDCNVAIFDGAHSAADVRAIRSMIDHGITVVTVTTREAFSRGIWICDFFGIEEAYTADAWAATPAARPPAAPPAGAFADDDIPF